MYELCSWTWNLKGFSFFLLNLYTFVNALIFSLWLFGAFVIASFQAHEDDIEEKKKYDKDFCKFTLIPIGQIIIFFIVMTIGYYIHK